MGPRPRELALEALWRSLVPAVRWRARRRLDGLEPGVATVVTVNWNSLEYLRVLLEVVSARSPAGTRIHVVDNASRDESRELLAGHKDVSAWRLPLNVGHDLALDLGFLTVQTEFAVALDVDAFPLHEDWLSELLAPLSDGYEIAGARLNRAYVHPCCLAIRTRRFVEQGYSFRSRYRPRRGETDASGDIGEEMSAAAGHENLFCFDPTSQRGPGDVGTIFGGFVYHNFYSTRFRGTSETVLDAVVDENDAALAWREAVARYGP